MLALLMLVVFLAVWVRRLLVARRETARLEEQVRMEEEARAREVRILAEMEADFLRR